MKLVNWIHYVCCVSVVIVCLNECLIHCGCSRVCVWTSWMSLKRRLSSGLYWSCLCEEPEALNQTHRTKNSRNNSIDCLFWNIFDDNYHTIYIWLDSIPLRSFIGLRALFSVYYPMLSDAWHLLLPFSLFSFRSIGLIPFDQLQLQFKSLEIEAMIVTTTKNGDLLELFSAFGHRSTNRCTPTTNYIDNAVYNYRSTSNDNPSRL